MIKINNSTSENKPLWLLGEFSGPAQTSRPTAPARPPRATARADTWTLLVRGLVTAVRTGARALLSWLAALPRRPGDRLFAMNDAEAYWSSWQIIRTYGLGRRYREPRFDTLAECPKCHGAGLTADQPCPPCLGTGRIILGEVS